jgi:hypothetical protein
VEEYEMVKRLIWSMVTRLAIACCGYINKEKNWPAGRWCEDCRDYGPGKWKHCENCIYSVGGVKKDNWKAKSRYCKDCVLFAQCLKRGYTVDDIVVDGEKCHQHACTEYREKEQGGRV